MTWITPHRSSRLGTALGACSWSQDGSSTSSPQQPPLCGDIPPASIPPTSLTGGPRGQTWLVQVPQRSPQSSLTSASIRNHLYLTIPEALLHCGAPLLRTYQSRQVESIRRYTIERFRCCIPSDSLKHIPSTVPIPVLDTPTPNKKDTPPSQAYYIALRTPPIHHPITSRGEAIAACSVRGTYSTSSATSSLHHLPTQHLHHRYST